MSWTSSQLLRKQFFQIGRKLATKSEAPAPMTNRISLVGFVCRGIWSILTHRAKSRKTAQRPLVKFSGGAEHLARFRRRFFPLPTSCLLVCPSATCSRFFCVPFWEPLPLKRKRRPRFRQPRPLHLQLEVQPLRAPATRLRPRLLFRATPAQPTAALTPAAPLRFSPAKRPASQQGELTQTATARTQRKPPTRARKTATARTATRKIVARKTEHPTPRAMAQQQLLPRVRGFRREEHLK